MANIQTRRFVPKGRTTALRSASLGKELVPDTQRVGVWDLEVYAGYLPRVLLLWNKVQPLFQFEMIDGSVSRSTSKGGESTVAWAKERLKPDRYSDAEAELRQNIVAQRVYPIAEAARTKFNFNLLVLLTPEMIAFEDGDETHWNYFSWSEGNVILVSAADIRRFSQQAGRRVEVALASMMLAQILCALLYPEVGFHKENRGCLFDFNEKRTTLKDTFAAMRIEPSCLETIRSPFRAAAEQMVEALHTYTG